jgi:hypothetical protein
MEKYEGKFAKSLSEEGVSENDAARIAGSEMEGAPEDKKGGIRSRQTYCQVLRYGENGPIDKDAKQASDEQRRQTAVALGLKPGASQGQVDAEVTRKYNLKR